jgi:hypothetical protein
VTTEDELWIPLVDEPIGSFVAGVQAEHPEIEELVSSPRRVLAFRTFAYIRVGVLLGRLFVEHDVKPADGAATWAEQLMRIPEHCDALVREVRTVAEEIAADPAYADESPLGPTEAERARFEEFARRRLAADV